MKHSVFFNMRGISFILLIVSAALLVWSVLVVRRVNALRNDVESARGGAVAAPPVGGGDNITRSKAVPRSSGILSDPVSMEGDGNDIAMHIGGKRIKCDPLPDCFGAFMEFNARSGAPIGWKDILNRSYVAFFRTNTVDRDHFYILYARRNSLFHFILGEREYGKCFLAAVIRGWYKAVYADKLSDLKLPKLDEPLPRLADAKIDVSKNIVTLKKGDWTLPLFSKNNTCIPQCVVFAVADANGNETIMRAKLQDEPAMEKLYGLLATGGKVTAIAPPDSPLHRLYNVPENRWDEIMRLNVTPNGEKVELFPMRLPGEGYIAKSGDGQYVYRKEGAAKADLRLIGDAPAADFGNGLCYAVTYNEKRQRIVTAKSFGDGKTAAKLMLSRNRDEKTLLICGKNSEFLGKYYPHLAEHTVLFAITPSGIRHAVQYGNGGFRIPAAAEPLDAVGAVSIQLADNVLIVNWGNASFAVPGNVFNSAVAAGRELAIKLPHHNPAAPTLFYVNNPLWLPDILKDFNHDFLLLGGERSKIPGLLKRKREAKFFVSLSRGSGWETYWNDGIHFRIDRKPVDEPK